jgi:hypothetical protein
MLETILKYFNIQFIIVVIIGFVVVNAAITNTLDSDGAIYAMGVLSGVLTLQLGGINNNKVEVADTINHNDGDKEGDN